MKWIENRYVKITLFVLSLFAIIIIVILSNFNTNKEKKTIKNNEVSENYIENVYEIGEFGKDYHDGISDFYDIAGANSDDDADTLIKNNMLSNSNDIENLIIKDNDAYELKHIDCGDGVYRRKIEDYDIFVLSKKSINENLNLSYISSIRSSFDAFIRNFIDFQNNGWEIQSSEIQKKDDCYFQYHASGVVYENNEMINLNIYCISNNQGLFTFAMTKTK